MLQRHPVIGSKGLDGPRAAESSDAGVLFAAERIVGEIVDRLIVDVRHAGFQPFGETRASLGVPCKNRTRKAVLRRVRDTQGVLVAFRAQDRRDGPEELVPGDRVLVADVAEDVRRKDESARLAAEDLWDPGAPSVFDVLAQVLQLALVDDRARP